MGEQAKQLTKADAAKMVRRPVTVAVTDKDGKAVKDEDGNPKTKTEHVAVAANEVLDFKDYGTHVVVVTKDGQKFSNKGDE